MRIEIIKGYASAELCAALSGIALQGIKDGWVGRGTYQGQAGHGKRLTSRFYGGRHQHQSVATNAAQSVRAAVGVSLFPHIEGHGRDGIVVSVTYPGGNVYAHRDSAPLGVATLRCNIIAQAPDAGGELFVGGEKIGVQQGDLHCYLASEHEHYVTEVLGNAPRILWMFGAYVPKDDWNSGLIKGKNGNLRNP